MCVPAIDEYIVSNLSYRYKNNVQTTVAQKGQFQKVYKLLRQHSTLAPESSSTTMKCEEYSYYRTVSEDEDDAQQMPARLFFDWNPGAVASFIIKLNGVNGVGIDFPQGFGPFEPTTQGNKKFQFELIRMLTSTSTGLEVRGAHGATTALAEDPSALTKLVARLATLSSKPWVQAVLHHGEPLPDKLFKVSMLWRNELLDVIDFEDPLIH